MFTAALLTGFLLAPPQTPGIGDGSLGHYPPSNKLVFKCGYPTYHGPVLPPKVRPKRGDLLPSLGRV